jgi:NADPH-dependent glutamate synthase beta subunit-like oxidoreductase
MERFMQDNTQHRFNSAIYGKKIAIVGGGPGGLTLARLLQQGAAQGCGV